MEERDRNEISRKKVRIILPFPSTSVLSHFTVFLGWASKEFRLAEEFRGDALSVWAGVFNI